MRDPPVLQVQLRLTPPLLLLLLLQLQLHLLLQPLAWHQQPLHSSLDR